MKIRMSNDSANNKRSSIYIYVYEISILIVNSTLFIFVALYIFGVIK